MHQDSKAQIFSVLSKGIYVGLTATWINEWLKHNLVFPSCMAVLSDSNVDSYKALEQIFFHSHQSCLFHAATLDLPQATTLF